MNTDVGYIGSAEIMALHRKGLTLREIINPWRALIRAKAAYRERAAAHCHVMDRLIAEQVAGAATREPWRPAKPKPTAPVGGW